MSSLNSILRFLGDPDLRGPAFDSRIHFKNCHILCFLFLFPFLSWSPCLSGICPHNPLKLFFNQGHQWLPYLYNQWSCLPYRQYLRQLIILSFWFTSLGFKDIHSFNFPFAFLATNSQVSLLVPHLLHAESWSGPGLRHLFLLFASMHSLILLEVLLIVFWYSHSIFTNPVMTYGLNSTLLYPTAYSVSPPGCLMDTFVMSKSGPLIFSPNPLFLQVFLSKWWLFLLLQSITLESGLILLSLTSYIQLKNKSCQFWLQSVFQCCCFPPHCGYLTQASKGFSLISHSPLTTLHSFFSVLKAGNSQIL